MAVSKSKKRKKKPSKRRPADPWDVLVHSHDLFLRELECVAEMYELVLPVLKERDKVRDARINELMDKIKTARGKTVPRDFIPTFKNSPNISAKSATPTECSVKGS